MIKMMELLKSLDLDIGDYCHGYRWSDKDPNDPWAVGYLKSILITRNRLWFLLQGDAVPNRWWQNCEKITEEEGKALLERPQDLI